MDFINDGIAKDCPQEYREVNKDVKYGTVKHVMYHSEVCKMDRWYSILLPASYDGVKKYPVVYFQHGIFGDESCIINDKANGINEIASNLASKGLAKEVIIVFANMYATDNPNLHPGFDAASVAPYDNFINELTISLMPAIESNYQVLTGRDNTAICGFSMGGRESLYIGLKRPDLFGYVGAFSPAPGLVAAKDRFMSHDGMLLPKEASFVGSDYEPFFLMISCGTKDSVVGQFPKSYHSLFDDNGVKHTWFEVDAADHDAKAIRSGFYYFLTNIF